MDQGMFEAAEKLGWMVVLCLMFGGTLIGMITWIKSLITNTVSKKLDDQKASIEKLWASKDQALQGAAEREARIIKTVNEAQQTLMTELGNLSKDVREALVTLNIMVKKQMNGVKND